MASRTISWRLSGRGGDPPALLAFVTDGAHRALGALGATRAPSSTAPALRSRGCGMLLALSWPLRREAPLEMLLRLLAEVSAAPDSALEVDGVSPRAWPGNRPSCGGQRSSKIAWPGRLRTEARGLGVVSSAPPGRSSGRFSP